MSASTVCISEASHQFLRELAEKSGLDLTDVLDKVVDCYRRQLFYTQMNAGYAELRSDPKAWEEHLAELKLWDATTMDGLNPAEHWTEDGRCMDYDEEKR